MRRVSWDDHASSLFDPQDGQLHDIYDFDTSIEDWDAVLGLVRSRGWWFEYLEDGRETRLPDTATQIMERRDDRSVSLIVKPFEAVGFKCHFFGPNEVEFDVAVRQFASQADLNELCGFMRALGTTLNKPVRLSPESLRNVALLTFRPELDDFTVDAG